MYTTTHCDEIFSNDNVIVGLGDSFTQGIGAYSLNTWKSIPYSPSTYNISGQYYIEEQGQNNWVRQLRDAFLPNYKVHNLGINGGGNRATIKELYLNPLPPNLNNVIVILMATGIERFDILKKNYGNVGHNWHQKWQTIWPNPSSDRGDISIIEKEYYRQIWSERNDAYEFLFNVCEVQNFCRANNYKFLFTSAFDSRVNKNSLTLSLKDKSAHIDIVDWGDLISLGKYTSFMDMLNQLDGGKKGEDMHLIHQKAASNPLPSKYITPCAHWTIEGQFEVAEYLYNEISNRGLV